MADSPIRQPSALFPIGMSLVSLGLVLFHFARHGIVHEVDEGTEAHLFQILMAGQVPVIAYFALKWLPRAPAQTLRALALQAAAAAAAFASVYFLT